MTNRYKGMTKIQIINALERGEKQQAQLRHALAGLYSAMSPQYEMQRIDSEGLGTFKPVLRKIVNYNGYGNNYHLDPDNELILGVRDAFNEAENVLRYHADGYSEGINVSMREYYDADERMVTQYRGYFMQHKGWYLNSHSERKKVEYRSAVGSSSFASGFIEVGPNEGGDNIPDDYVWERDRMRWVHPDNIGKWGDNSDSTKVWNTHVSNYREVKVVGSIPRGGI